MAFKFIDTNEEDLNVGDTIQLLGASRTITEINVYKGPLSEYVFAIAKFYPGPCTEISLCYGQTIPVLKNETNPSV